MTIIGEFFKGVGDAQIFDRGRFFKPDFDGIVVVQKTIYKETRNKGMAFIVEMLVEQSNHPDHPVGWKGSWFQKLIDKDVAYPALKAWAAACYGFQPHQKAEIDEKLAPVLDELLNDAVKNPDTNEFVGTRLRLTTTLRKTQNNTDFTTYDFAPVK